jgi:hypothetical protein
MIAHAAQNSHDSWQEAVMEHRLCENDVTEMPGALRMRAVASSTLLKVLNRAHSRIKQATLFRRALFVHLVGLDFTDGHCNLYRDGLRCSAINVNRRHGSDGQKESTPGRNATNVCDEQKNPKAQRKQETYNFFGA